MSFRIVAGFVAMLTSGPLLAQGFTVQQPVVSQFSVGTSVLVPDRGGVLLGAVKRAGDVGRQFGPLGLAGRSRGSFRDYSGVSAHVWIHDFEAMDRYLLSQPVGHAAVADDFFLGGAGARPSTTGLWQMRHYDRMTLSPLEAPQRRGLPPAPSATAPAGPSAPPAPEVDDGSDRAESHYHMGLKALARCNGEVAKIHFRIAARHGSDEAARLLAKLGGNVSAD
jgi:hypothetical protein